MDVGQRLKMRRNELKLTQDYVAEKLGITRQTISNWENGRSYPDIERIIRLSELYELSLDELLKGDQKMVKHLQENTLVTHFLKLFIAMLTINFLLMLVLLVNQTLNEVFLLAIFALISINTFALFYLIIKKI
ncbi:helix-turn-helix transcriptional regulator [Enterococcus pseudoavium]|uniref:Helix-turn-helix transcriptional regulator n=1 Tax=Enterococcus pseudoavium TaxID=44007 RepID=A0AAE4I0K6_9ENTE|nr:helix-turn-helix transcriptional regulator [Enterococcus pseudoavium]MDT2735554.1 helix-turn-helix transcriptional regulator [Enterococcus pseudoavium]MDT2754521.1 helix-turn-helix transcriptional regulator [Enterococcus pseudoavium]MDT2769423.1 helix-turn-helix transcriptional regulator [Enterococcus pseudoavium]REC31082.1 transcriptional regulator [Enterococcus pseudoavium]